MRNLSKSCASFFWRSPVFAVPKLVTAGSSLPVGMSFAVLTHWVPELCVLSVAVPSTAPHLSPVLVVLEDL